jgi:peptidoglycan/xylan/chitin deacetylase (PgdA/CDA1 family)
MFRFIRFTGLPFIFRELIQRKKITILLFHDITEPTAEMTFRYLSKKYNVIPLNTLIEAIEQKDKSKIPEKALVITFDDGLIGNYKILETAIKYNLPITIFLCAAIINTNKSYWFKHQKIQASREDLKKITTRERLEFLSKLGLDIEKEYDQPQALQKTHIDEMKKYINFQGHTMYHPILPMCEYSDARKEIFQSKAILEKDFGLNINTISYPNGDYSERDIQLAKEAGYRCGITVDFGFNTIHSDIFRLKRISISDMPDINEVCVKASGVWAFFKTLNGYKQKAGFTKKTA